MGFSRLKKISLYTKNQLSSSKIDNFRAKKLYGQNADFRNTLPATVHYDIKKFPRLLQEFIKTREGKMERKVRNS